MLLFTSSYSISETNTCSGAGLGPGREKKLAPDRTGSTPTRIWWVAWPQANHLSSLGLSVILLLLNKHVLIVFTTCHCSKHFPNINLVNPHNSPGGDWSTAWLYNQHLQNQDQTSAPGPQGLHSSTRLCACLYSKGLGELTSKFPSSSSKQWVYGGLPKDSPELGTATSPQPEQMSAQDVQDIRRKQSPNHQRLLQNTDSGYMCLVYKKFRKAFIFFTVYPILK